MDELNKTLERLNKEYQEVVRILDPNKGYTILENCNYIVVNKINDVIDCRLYTIGSKWDDTKQKTCINVVCGATFPTQFTKEEAEYLTDYNVSNGRGKIEWEVMDKITFYQHKEEELKHLIELFETHMKGVEGK